MSTSQGNTQADAEGHSGIRRSTVSRRSYETRPINDDSFVVALRGGRPMDGHALRTILGCVEDGVVGVDSAGGLLFASAAAERLLGPGSLAERLTQARDVFRADGVSAFAPSDLPLVRALRGEATDGVALVVRARESELVRLEMSGRPLADGGAAVVFRDVGARIRAEQELVRTKAFLDSIVENIPTMIFVKDAEQLRFELFNRAGEDLLGLPRSKLLGKTDFDLFPHEQAQSFQKRDRETLESRNVVDISEEPIATEKGERWLHTRKITITDHTGKPKYLLGISLDITDRMRAEADLRVAHEELEARVAERTEALRVGEEQLRQSQKMEAIGRLAGGIAHDFNNMLTVILTQSTLLVRRTQLDERTRGPLTEITHAANRAATLTRQLLAFSRQQVLQPRTLDLNMIVREMEQMLRSLVGESIALETSLQPGLGFVFADPGQMEQVILNLVVNARDAMPRGGQLVIATCDVVIAQGAPSIGALQPGAYELLTVTDTGIGMSADTQSRIFEPFFTTKERGHGTGLGLATAYGIVRQTDGDVHVSSEPGKGTSFRIYVPRAAPASTPSLRPSGAHAIGGPETLLLVEDEPLVREAARTVLAGAGFTVLVARDAAEALQICRDHPATIHALVTDVVMPGMSGPRLAERAAVMRPEMRVLFVSGYTDDAVVRHGAGESVAFLNKPFLPDALVRKLREVLDGA